MANAVNAAPAVNVVSAAKAVVGDRAERGDERRAVAKAVAAA